MNNASVLEKLANPELVKSMTVNEKLMGAAMVALLGMAITFIALLILWGLIAIMTKLCAPKPQAAKPAVQAEAPKQATVTTVAQEDDEELIAVITAAIAASLQTSTHNLVVRNIVRVDDSTPAWGRAGRVDQMNRMI